jgi:hypothetical protein
MNEKSPSYTAEENIGGDGQTKLATTTKKDTDCLITDTSQINQILMNVEIIFTIMSYMFPSRTHYELA